MFDVVAAARRKKKKKRKPKGDFPVPVDIPEFCGDCLVMFSPIISSQLEFLTHPTRNGRTGVPGPTAYPTSQLGP
jgi:hypothetical protein